MAYNTKVDYKKIDRDVKKAAADAKKQAKNKLGMDRPGKLLTLFIGGVAFVVGMCAGLAAGILTLAKDLPQLGRSNDKKEGEA